MHLSEDMIFSRAACYLDKILATSFHEKNLATKFISVFMYLIFSLDFKIKNRQTVKQFFRQKERSTKYDMRPTMIVETFRYEDDYEYEIWL